MTKEKWELFGIICFWAVCIVGPLVLKAILDARRDKVWKETQPAIDKGLQELIKSIKK